jgi:hypothetical protein
MSKAVSFIARLSTMRWPGHSSKKKADMELDSERRLEEGASDLVLEKSLMKKRPKTEATRPTRSTSSVLLGRSNCSPVKPTPEPELRRGGSGTVLLGRANSGPLSKQDASKVPHGRHSGLVCGSHHHEAGRSCKLAVAGSPQAAFVPPGRVPPPPAVTATENPAPAGTIAAAPPRVNSQDYATVRIDKTTAVPDSLYWALVRDGEMARKRGQHQLKGRGSTKQHLVKARQ